MPSGIIIKGIGGFYYVSSGDDIYECKARGIFRKDDVTPLTGDRVTFSVTDPLQKKGNIDKIMERTTVLTRPAAANVDLLVVVIAARSPEPDLMLLDKLLVTAAKKKIEAVICINKTDLDPEDRRAELRSSYISAGYTVIETCMGESTGFGRLRDILKGHVAVFAGQSGVGKSTLLNRIAETVVMQTGSISEKIERGRHTTRHTELIKLPNGGFVVDTPGFSSFELAQIAHTELKQLFPEFADHVHKCRFTGCMHINEPDCGVKDAVEDGTISRGRYRRYIELHTILKQQDDMKYKKTNRKGTKGND